MSLWIVLLHNLEFNMMNLFVCELICGIFLNKVQQFTLVRVVIDGSILKIGYLKSRLWNLF